MNKSRCPDCKSHFRSVTHFEKCDVPNNVFNENRRLFENLAGNAYCPGCNKFVKGPFYNLGIKFDWFEGCSTCAEKYNGPIS